ncbi:MAG TPA: helix-turn-helix transcriptional regulator [Candidatus Limnocylindrales bacterium]|nr:helix-turn-helix transcriptional regulator [Candidatus Limnocylindrales bacterium]
MDTVGAGVRFRAVRLKKRWRQEDVAARAAVSRSVVSRVERGLWDGLTVGSILAVAAALGIRLRISAYWQGADLDRLLNARHSLLHEAVSGELRRIGGWELAPEVSYSIMGERGVIDILAWHAVSRTLLVVELKTEIVDVNELLGKLDQKRRLGSRVARDRGWRPVAAAAWLVVAEGSTNRRRAQAHAAMLRAALPLDGRSMPAWLHHPNGPVGALSFWSTARGVSSKGGLATVRRVRRPNDAAA